jgi:hypothetical protein
MPPSNQRPAQNSAISSSTAGKPTQYFKFPMNRWCNFDPKDPSWDTIINPNYAHKNIIDPVISTTDFDSSAGINSTKLASLAKPTADIQSNQEDISLKEQLKKIEDMIYEAGETGTGSDSDIVEIPVPVPDVAPANDPTTSLEGAGAVPAPTPDQAKSGERKETIILSSDSETMSVEVLILTDGPINSVGNTNKFATASSTPRTRSTTCSMASASNSNSSILDQDTEEVQPANY